MPVVGGTAGVAVEVDMVEYVTWKKSNSKWKIQESWMGKRGNVKPKEKTRRRMTEFFSLIISI